MAFKQRINGTIYSDGWFGWQLEHALNHHKEEDVHLVITSPGGEVGEAIRLSDLIKAHGRVTIEFSGLAASAATWLAFAANKVIMHSDTLWLCHRTSTTVAEWESMNEEELSAYISKLESQKKSLEVLDAIIAQKYLDRCKKNEKTLKDIVDLMKEERYLSPADCLEWGFVDEIIEESAHEDDIVNMVNHFNLPACPNVQTQQKQVEEKVSMGNIVELVFNKMRDFFELKREPKDNNSNIKMKKIMNLALLNALLSVEHFEADEQNSMVQLSEQNLAQINQRLQDLGACETELNEIVDALDKISPAIKSISGIKNKIAAVTAIMDKIPTSVAQQPAAPATPAQGNNNVEGSDFINEVAAKYMK